MWSGLGFAADRRIVRPLFLLSVSLPQICVLLFSLSVSLCAISGRWLQFFIRTVSRFPLFYYLLPSIFSFPLYFLSSKRNVMGII